MSKQPNELYEFGPFRVDPKEHLLLRDGEAVSLTPKAFETLLVLLQNSGHLMLKDELMKALWPDSFVEEVNLSQNISMLRRVLGDSAQSSRYIVTVPGKGYRFVGEVRTLAQEVGEDLVVESRSRSRIVIEEQVVEDEDEGEVGGNPPAFVLDQGRVLALPAGDIDVRGRWRWLVALSILGTAVAALVLYALFSPPPVPRVLRSVRLTHSGRVSPYSRVLTDGYRLYFTETAGAKWALAQVPIGGGEPTPIAASLPSISLQDIDSTRSRFLVVSQGPEVPAPLWVMPVGGGSAQRLGDINALDGAWSLHDQSIAYCREGSIYVAAADGSQPRKLISVHGFITILRWSPDGRRLRFTVRDPADGGRSLWEASADGGDPHPLSLGWTHFAHRWGEGEYSGDWTQDGKYYVFRSERNNVESLWVIREKPRWFHRAGNPPVQIYTSPNPIGEPRFSADGKKLFFVGHQEQRELVRYDDSRRMFVPYMGGISARLLNFSPDGQWVSYRNDVDATLWRSHPDGSEKIQLTFPPLTVLHSSWSPDGKTIAFQGSAPGEASKLYTVPSGGGNPEVLLRDAAASLAAPSWCGDGRNILFMRWNRNVLGGRSSGVSLLDMKTHESRNLPGTDGFDGIHCSPDGKYAAASDKMNRKLVLYDFNTEHWSVLSDGAPYGWGIRWSIDSRYVYYQHAEEEEEQPIYRVRVSDRKVEQITSSRQILRADVLSYTLTGLTPDNSPLASLVRRNSDVYALELELP